MLQSVAAEWQPVPGQTMHVGEASCYCSHPACWQEVAHPPAVVAAAVALLHLASLLMIGVAAGEIDVAVVARGAD